MRPIATLPALVLALASAVVPATSSSAQARTTPTCHGLRVTILGTPGDDTITGTNGPDVIKTFGGVDEIHARGGDDTICAGKRADRVWGGDGDDWIKGAAGYDSLYGDDGADTLIPGAVVSGSRVNLLDGGAGDDHYAVARGTVLDYTKSPVGVTADFRAGTVDGWGHDTLQADSNLKFYGSDYADTVYAGAAGDYISTRDGDDVIYDSDKGDLINPGNGANQVWGAGGNDIIDLSPDEDTDVVHAGGGDDYVSAFNNGAVRGVGDTVYGDGGDDRVDVATSFAPGQVIDLGTGLDTLHLTLVPPTPDSRWAEVDLDMTAGTVTADGAEVQAAGAESVDVLTGVAPNDLIGAVRARGTEGDDTIQLPLLAPETIDALGGDDVILGGFRDDVIHGGDGTDLVDASSGNDTCYSVEGHPGNTNSMSCETKLP